MRIEQQRVAERQEQVRKQEEIRRQEQREAALRQHQQQLQRLQAEEQQRAAHQQKAREEAARIQALQQAILDRERQEALERCRALEAVQELRHQTQLHQLRQQGLNRKLRVALALVSIGWCATVLGASVGYFGAVRPGADQRYAQLGERFSNSERQNEAFKRQLEAQAMRIDKLLDDLRESETTRARLTAQLQQTLQQLDRSGRKANAAGGQSTTPPASTTQCSREDDPLCSHGRLLNDR